MTVDVRSAGTPRAVTRTDQYHRHRLQRQAAPDIPTITAPIPGVGRVQVAWEQCVCQHAESMSEGDTPHSHPTTPTGLATSRGRVHPKGQVIWMHPIGQATCVHLKGQATQCTLFFFQLYILPVTSCSAKLFFHTVLG